MVEHVPCLTNSPEDTELRHHIYYFAFRRNTNNTMAMVYVFVVGLFIHFQL